MSIPSVRLFRRPALAAVALIAAGSLMAAETTTTYTEATVWAMWIKQSDIPVPGASRFTVRISPNKTKDAAVGLIEHSLGGAGDTWKSSAWIAAVAASNTKNVLLTDYEFLLKVRGYIDGPSAGMLMAATMLALMNGDTIRENVTITGTVNPDGTIGPISGLDLKMQAAQKAGIKEIGYPMIDDGDAAKFVADIKAQGDKLGVTTVPVGDIYQAYEFLTGRKLGRPQPLDAAEMDFSPAQKTRITAAAQELLTEAKVRLQAAIEKYNKLNQLPAETKKVFAEIMSVTQRLISEAEKHATAEALMMAHSRASLADASSRMAEEFTNWQAPVLKNDNKALVAAYEAKFASAEKQLAGLTATLAAGFNAPTLAGRISGLHSQLQYWVVRSQLLAATAGRSEIVARKSALRRASETKSKSFKELEAESAAIAQAMYDAVERLAILESRIRAIAGMAAFPVDESPLPAPNLTDLNKRLAEAYGPAAAAGLAYFETTVIGHSNKEDGDAAMMRKGAILAKDIQYATCAEAVAHAVRISDEEDELPGASMDRLACGAHAYLGMSGLMNKYFNLADETNNSTPVTYTTTLTLHKGQAVSRMLESSRRRVLEEASLVKQQLHFIPESVKMNFNLGETKRNDPSDFAKLDAITSYWRAHFLCRMAQMMAKAK